MKRILDALRPWLGIAVAAVLSLLLFRQCSRTGSAEAELARAREAAELRNAGQVVTEPVEDLGPALAAAEAENATLRAALEEARRAAPRARPVAVVRTATAPAPATGTPTPSAPPCPGQPACWLAAGDHLRVTVDQVVLRTEAGNHVLVGAAAVERTGTAPAVLHRGSFSAPVTVALEQASRERGPDGWGVGPWLGAGSDGWAAGAAVAAPALSLPWVGWRVEASAGGGLGPGGRVAASVQAIVREQ